MKKPNFFFPVVILLGFSSVLQAQQTLDKIPGFQRSRSITAEIGKLVKSSPIRKVEWIEDGSALLYTLNGQKRQLNLSDLSESEAEKKGNRSPHPTPVDRNELGHQCPPRPATHRRSFARQKLESNLQRLQRMARIPSRW